MNKTLLRVLQGDENKDISDPSFSIHSDRVTSREATETFSDILSISESKVGELTYPQKQLFKRMADLEIQTHLKIHQY